MSDMNQFLAQYYGTTAGTDDTLAEKTASEQAQEEANLELFAKMAHENGIDLEKLSEEQVLELYNATFDKVAEEDKAPPFAKKDDDKDDGKKDEDEKKAAAEAEFTEKKAAAEKIAEADFLGRVMAHAYVNEMRKIASAAETGEEKDASAEMKVRSFGDKLRSAAHHAKETAGKAKDHASSAADKGGKALEYVGKKVTEKATGVGTHGMNPSHAKGVGAATVGAGAAAVGGAAYGASKARKGKDKEASALDELAIKRAMDMVDGFNKEAGADVYDLEEVARRVDAVDTLGLAESVKVASAENAEQAVEVRALEYLEAAGLPITWAE
jgi:hypothetical protein